MFWILRRSRFSNAAVSFFNSINNSNNNNAASNNGVKDSNKNNNNTLYASSSEKRPARKSYDRLPSSDEKFDGDLADFEDDEESHEEDEDEMQRDANLTSCGVNGCCCDCQCLVGSEQENSKQRNANYELNENRAKGNGGLASSTTPASIYAEYDLDEYEESLTCNVCDRSFSCHRSLAAHKQKKRHFGCSGCDSLFPTLMALEHHKEEFEHWSGTEECYTESEDENDNDDYRIGAAAEEMERLL